MTIEKKRNSSLKNALKILKLFSIEHPEMGVTEIARKLNVSKSTAHRLLTSLVEEEMVFKDPKTNLYSLGSSVLSLANIVNSQIPIANEVIPLLNTLTNLTNESSHLSILEGYEVVYLQSKEGGFFSESKIQQGTRRSAFKCAAGLVILAFNNDPMPQKRHAAYLLSASKNFHDEKFQQIRKNIQHKGYAITTRGNDEKEVEIAVPVKNEQQKVIAALSVTAPMSRIAAIPVQKRIIRLLETEANKLHQIIRLRKRSAKYAKQ